VFADDFIDFSKLALTHSFTTADSNLLESSISKFRNSFTFALHKPKEFGHLSEEPEVQNCVKEKCISVKKSLGKIKFKVLNNSLQFLSEISSFQ